MDIHNSIGVSIIQLWISVTELCTSVSNDGYPKFTTIMDIHNELWVNVVKDAMIPIHCTVNATHNPIMNTHNSNIDIHDSTDGYS